MVDQESQTLPTDVPTSPLKTNQMFNGITSPHPQADDHSTWASNSTEPPSLAITNANAEDGDDYDPLYAVPNHLGTKKITGQQNNKQPMVHANNHRIATSVSSSSHVNTSLETNSSSHQYPFKCSSPSSVPKYSRNFNLERSQSLRVSRKSQRSISSASKGGSLR